MGCEGASTTLQVQLIVLPRSSCIGKGRQSVVIKLTAVAFE